MAYIGEESILGAVVHTEFLIGAFEFAGPRLHLVLHGLEFGHEVQYKLHDTNTGLDTIAIVNECRRQLIPGGLFVPAVGKYAL